MKKAILITYAVTKRVIANIDKEEDFEDSVIEDVFEQAIEDMRQNGALSSYVDSEEDVQLPYSPEDDLNL